MTDNEETITATIDGAEEVRDPLEGLVEKTKLDPGAPFMPEVLAALAALQKDDRAAFETLRAQLKVAGCRMMALNEALADASDETGLGHKPTQADILLDLAQAAELFHTPDGTGFADIDVDGHRETWPVRSKSFRRWLVHRFFAETSGGAPSSEALRSAFDVIEAKATHFDAPEHVVHVRVGRSDSRIYLDLCNKTWQAVEIDSAGWRVIDTPPVRFRRTAGMRPLPVPVAGGSIEDLRPYLNVRSDADFIMVVAWILAALRPHGPYPVLSLFGEGGTAKSTLLGIIGALVDPSIQSLLAPPRDDRDLFINAVNRYALIFDNISVLLDWITDSLSRLATGAGFSTRALYTDQDEVLLDAIRPIALAGIEDFVRRPDLADRAIFLTLEPIPDDKRRPESELWAAFNADRPRILGALLDAVALGLQQLPAIRLERLPRMADFAIWATACETALRHQDGTVWKAGTFMAAYVGNIDTAILTVLDNNPIAVAVREFMRHQTTWSGTATDLLDLLGRVAGEKATRAKTWPVDATRLAGRLRRAATFLRKVGIEIISTRQGHERTRTITISSVQPEQEDNSASSASAPQAVAADTNGRGGVGDPYLPDKYIHQFAKKYSDVAATELEKTGDVDRTALDRWVRESLAKLGVPPQSVEVDFNRVMAVLSTLH